MVLQKQAVTAVTVVAYKKITYLKSSKFRVIIHPSEGHGLKFKKYLKLINPPASKPAFKSNLEVGLSLF